MDQCTVLLTQINAAVIYRYRLRDLRDLCRSGNTGPRDSYVYAARLQADILATAFCNARDVTPNRTIAPEEMRAVPNRSI